MAVFFAACLSLPGSERSDRDQFWKTARGLGFGMLVTLSVACSQSDGGTATTSGTVAPASTTTAVEATATSSTLGDVTTTAPSVANRPVIVGSGGVLGYWQDGWTPAESADAVPLEAGATFQVVGPSGIVGTAIGSAPERGCEIVENHVVLDLDPNPYVEYNPFVSSPIAIAADWDLTPFRVVALPLDSPAYIEIVHEYLLTSGYEEPDPQIVQLYQTDLEGDGVDEVIIVADNIDGDFFKEAAYSLILVRKVIAEEVQTAVLHESIVLGGQDENEIPFNVTARIAAIADLDGDGAMEIALDSAYYEGAATEIFDYIDGDIGFISALLTGCGA